MSRTLFLFFPLLFLLLIDVHNSLLFPSALFQLRTAKHFSRVLSLSSFSCRRSFVRSSLFLLSTPKRSALLYYSNPPRNTQSTARRRILWLLTLSLYALPTVNAPFIFPEVELLQKPALYVLSKKVVWRAFVNVCVDGWSFIQGNWGSSLSQLQWE